jgi:hemerythrin-like domain-containing protein
MAGIFDRLIADHNKHRKLLSQIAETIGDSEERRTLFEQFRIDVTAHASAEEQSLYAEMMARPDLSDEARHSVAEHKELDDLIGELVEMDMSSPGWLTKFKTLRHDYEHHIEEEEKEIFPAADAELSKAVAAKLGQIFANRKPAEMEKAAEGHAADERE